MPPQCCLLQAQGHSRLTMSSYMTPGMGPAPGMSMPNMGAQQMMSRTQLGSQMGAGAGSYGGAPSLAELQQLQGLSGRSHTAQHSRKLRIYVVHVASGQTIWRQAQQLASGCPSPELCCWCCLQGPSRSRS